MNLRIIRQKGMILSTLFFVLLNVAGMTKLQAENIIFSDANVKAVCIMHWDTDGDEELSYAEAAAVMDLGEVFTHNDSITSFNELQYFTGLTTLAQYAFGWCLNLTSVIIPNSVTTIEASFYDCRSLVSIIIPQSVSSISSSAFSGCDVLEQIVVDENNTVYDSRNNCNAIIKTENNELIQGCTTTVIPNSVVSIGWNAFSLIGGLTTIIIPKSVTSISYTSFYACSGLEVIIVSPENPVYDSRDNCNAIIETNTNKLVAGSKNTIIPNTVTTIGTYAFSYRYYSGEDNYAISIPNSVSILESRSFLGCRSMVSLVIPSSVTNIGDYCFDECWSLASMTVLATEPPLLGQKAFDDVDKSIPVDVPCGTIEVYSNANGWSEFTNFLEDECTYVGIINGLFSINSNGDQVYFSQGNLQYQASTNTWRFAENQWDYLGEGNTNASSIYEGWIDLFSWGTSGYNHGAVCYQPWSTGGQYDHAAYAHNEYDLCDGNGQADWGYNAISNGGNQEMQWRTCRASEWQYVLEGRETASGIRFAKAVVNGINGLIVLPDNWNPIIYDLNNANNGDVSYDVNVISFDDWKDVLEFNGAVFLPAAGNIQSWSNNNFGTRGVYWSATGYAPWLKSLFDFQEDYVNSWGAYYPDERYSVRLIRSASSVSNISATSNPVECGSVVGTGICQNGQTCTLTATPIEGYSFLYWKENGKVVSTENPYTFAVGFNRMLEACFLENSTYPLLYSFNEDDLTASVIGHWDGQNAVGDLVIPETVLHLGNIYTVTSIGSSAFQVCSGLTSVEIPNSVTVISYGAFSDCSGLTEIVIPESVTIIGSTAFVGTSIDSMVIPESVISLGNQVFYGCGNLSSVILPSGITSLGYGLFQYCGNLASITIPAGVTWIDEYAFLNCGLTSITLLAPIPASIHEQAFEGVNPDIPVYVPCGSESTYSDLLWGGFNNFIGMCSAEITATSNPTNGGTVIGSGTYQYGQICTLIATPTTGYHFINWTKDGVDVSTEAEYSFIVTENASYVANFSDSNANHWNVDIHQYPYNMSVTGVIQIDGVEQQTETLEIGAFCGSECRGTQRLTYFPQVNRYLVFFTLYGDAGDVMNFHLYDHSIGQELDLSSSSTITFVPDGFLGTAFEPYVFTFGNTTVDQVSTFSQGYNWWSTYIEQEGIDGLTMLQEGLGSNGVTIRSQASGYTDYYDGYGWFGSLTGINNESSYRIITNAACSVTMTGSLAVPSEHLLTLSQGWTWIGYVPSTMMSVEEAFANLDAVQGDKLKSQQGYADYYPGYGWFGSLNTIEPGMGLMYYSANSETVTFTYPDSGRGGELKKNLTAENNHWKPNTFAYPDNMTVMAVVELNEMELKSDNYELAAFANGECRGSVRLTYAEPLHRHVAFLTISGKDAAELNFRLYDTETGMEYYDAEESLDFVTNAIVGMADDLYTIHFRGTMGKDELAHSAKVYPNPVNRGEQFSVGLAETEARLVRVEIVNTLGAIVSAVTSTKLPASLVAPETTGVYTVKILVDNKAVYCRKLVVR